MKRFLLLFLILLTSINTSWAFGIYYGQLILGVSSGSGYVLASTSKSATVGTLTSSSSSNSSFAIGSNTTLTFYAIAEAADGYTFVGWATTQGSTTATYTGNPYTVSIIAEGSSSSPTTTTLYAIFQKNPDFYASATAISDANQGVAYASFTEGSYSSNSVTTSKSAASSTATGTDFTAYYKATGTGSYAFTGWSTSQGGSIVSTDNPYSKTFTSTSKDSNSPTNYTLYANFAKADPYNFAATATSTNTTAGSATATLSDGTTVNGIGSAKNTATFTATANQGYVFAGWGETANATTYVSTSSTYTVELTNDVANSTVSKTLYAFFDEYADPLQPTSSNPAKNSNVTSSLTTVSVTYGTAISSMSSPTLRIYDKASYDADDWCEPLIYSTGTPTLSSDSKTLTFTLENPLQTPGTYYFWIGAQRLTFTDGNKNTEVLIPFTYSEKQMTLVSTNPGDSIPAMSPLSSFSITYEEDITNTPAADGLKVYALSTYDEYALNPSYNYSLATSSSASVSGNTVTYTFATPITTCGTFKVQLTHGALESNGAKSPALDQYLVLYQNPVVTPMSDTEQTSIDKITLTYAGVALNVNREAFGNAAGEGTTYIEKKKGGTWIQYCVAKINASKTDGASAEIIPIEVDEKGFTTDTISLSIPGTYRITVAAGSLYSYLGATSNPVWQYINQPLTITYTIPGDESMDYLRPISTNPADLSEVSTQFDTFSMTYSMDVTTVNAASNMAVYDKSGNQLATATNAVKSDDNRTVTYTLTSPITIKDTVTVKVATGAVTGEGWANDQVKRRVIIAERFNVTGGVADESWKVNSIDVDIDYSGHDTIYVSPLQKQLIVYKADGTSTGKHVAPSQDIIYNTSSHTRTLKFLESGYLLGEGDYYVDMPAKYLRIIKPGTTNNYIYSEATRINFSLGKQPATTFTVDPADGSTVSSIDKFVLTITDCDTICKAGIYSNEYLYVSKNGGTPLRYALFSSDRDSTSSSGTSSSLGFSTDTQTMFVLSKTGATINIASGFKTPEIDSLGVATGKGWADNYGYASSGTYTITIPKNTFKIDGSYYNTDMTFTYIVKNNVVETRKFTGDFDITPDAGDTIVYAFDQLKEIILHFRDASSASITSIQANITGPTSKITYLNIKTYEQVDSITWKLIMNPQNVTEHQDNALTLTFTGVFVVNGSKYTIDTSDNMDYNHEPITQTWLYMTEEAYKANTVTFSPVGGTIASLSTITVTPTSEYKYLSNFKWPDIKIYRNGIEMSGYVMIGKSTGSTTTGSLTLYKKNSDDNTAHKLIMPGTYTIVVPWGYFPLQNTTTYANAYSKEETLTFVIPADVNQDGKYNTLSDIAKLIHYLNNGETIDTHEEADIDGDFKITSDDVKSLVNTILNIK